MKKQLSLLMLVAAMLLPLASRSQGVNTYTIASSTTTYTSIATTSNLLSSVTGDAGTQAVSLPFTFPFGETVYPAGTQLSVRADGYVYFGNTQPGHSCKSAWTSTTNYSLIAPLITYDGKITANGTTSGAYSTVTTDSAGDQMLVVEFKSVMCYYTPNGNYNYQLRLYGDGRISVVYGACTASTNSSMVHNFFLINGTSDKVCLSGSWTAPTLLTTATALPDISGVPASGTVLTYTPPVITCERPLLTQANITALEENSVSFSWTAPSGIAQFQYLCLPAGSTPDWTNATLVTGSTVTVSSLASYTDYDFYLRSYCSASDQSFASKVTFMTSPGCGTMTFSQPSINDGTSSGYSTPFYSYPSSSYTHGASWYVFKADELADAEVFTGDIHGLAWDCSVTTPQSARFKVYMADTNIAGFSSSTDTISRSAMTLVYDGRMTFRQGWNEVRFDSVFQHNSASNMVIMVVRDSVVTGTINFAYRYLSTSPYLGIYRYGSGGLTSGSTGYRPVTRFSQCAEPPSCWRVQTFVCDSATADEVYLSWTDSRNSSATYTIMAYNEISGDSTVASGISGDSYTFTGLAANTPYRFVISSDCGGSTSELTRTVSVRTQCAPMAQLPFSEDFESLASGSNSRPFCWTMVHTNGSYPYISTTAHSSTRSLYFYASNSTPLMVATPLINGNADELHVSFWAYCSNYGIIEAGLMTDPDNDSTFVPMLTINGNGSTWNEYEFYTDTVSFTGNVCVAFRYRGTGSSSYSSYIDDIYIEQASDCRRPIATSIFSVEHFTATLAWEPSGSYASSYQVAYSTVNDVESPSVMMENASGTSIELTGLQPSTTYYAWVRSLCGTEQTSWKAFPSFTTNLSCYPVNGLTVTNVDLTAASLSWSFDAAGRGIEPTSVIVTCIDQTDSTASPIVLEVEGNATIITGLAQAHSYSVRVRTVCATDTATQVSVSFTTLACGQLQGTTTSSYSPFQANYNYGYTQTIYPASTLSAIDTLTGISFRQTSTPSTHYMRQVEVYIGYTSNTTISTSNYIPASQLTLAGTGTINDSSTGWKTINFATPQVVNHDSNIVVAVVNKTGHYSSFSWGAHTQSQQGGIGGTVYWYRDSDTIFPTSPAGSSGSSTTAIPDVIFVGSCNVSCIAPLAVATSATSSSIDLLWNSAGANDWVVRYMSTTDTAWTYADAYDTTATIIGLIPNTQYIFNVGSLCGNDTLYSPTVSARTECADVATLPFFEGFEGYTTGSGNFPYCWSYYRGNSGSNCYISSSYTHEGTRSLYSYSSASMPVYVATPMLDANANELQVSFWAAISSSVPLFEAGLMTDPTDLTTFVPFFTVEGGNGLTSTEYVFYTDTTGISDPVCVAFRHSANGASVYFDNISISEFEGCYMPGNVSVTSVASDGAVLTWEGDASNSYIFTVCSVNDIDDTSALTFTAVGDTTITLTGLLPNTTYYVWGRTDCGAMLSGWTNPVSFRTECANESLPFVEDFDGITNISQLECWRRYNGLFDTVPTLTSTISGWTYYTAYGLGHSKHVKLNIYGTSCRYWLVSPVINLTADAVLTFDMALTAYANDNVPSATSNDDRFLVAVSTDGNSWTPLRQWGFDTTRDDAVYSSIGLNDQVTIMLTNYVGENIRIAFYGESTVSGGDNDLHIDNIMITSSDCMRPSEVVSNATDNTATLTWRDLSSTPGTFDLVLSPSNSMSDTAAIAVSGIADTTYTFTGLTSTTTYYWFVRNNCDSTSWVSGTVRTACPMISLPYTEGFEGYAVYSMHDCWTRVLTYSTSSYTYPYISSTNHTGTRSMYVYSSGSANSAAVASPFIPEPLNNLEISFWARRSSGTINVGVMTDLNDITTYQTLLTINSSNASSTSTWYEFNLTTPSLLGSTLPDSGYVVFRVNGSNYGYIDDIDIRPYNPCRMPYNFVLDSANYYMGAMSWSDSANAGNYRVYWSTVNDITTADSVDVTTMSVVVNGLTQATTYYVWVRSLCGTGMSDVAYVGPFTTDESCYPIVNLSISGVSSTSAAFAWETDARGITPNNVMVTLENLSDSSVAPVTTMTSGANYHLFSGLAESNMYRATFRNICDPDTSNAVVYVFSTVRPACLSLEGDTVINYLPFYGYYNYGYSQMIYKAAQVGVLDTVTGISLRVASVPASYQSRPVKVWIGNTAQSHVSATNLVAPANMTYVGEGTLDVSSVGWASFAFTTPFVYNGTGNIVVAIQNLTGHYSSFQWGAHRDTTGSYIGWWRDSDPIAYDTVVGGTTIAVDTCHGYMPDIRFHGNCAAPSCSAPVAVAGGTTTSSITVNWLAGGSETAWTVEYRQFGTTAWTTAVASTAATTYTVTGLTQGTNYQLRVGSLCSSDTVYCSIINAMTQCGAATLPFEQNFDGLTTSTTAGTGVHVNCWDYEMLGTSTYQGASYQPQVYYGATNAASGNYSLRLYGNSYTMLPEMPTSLDSLQLVFSHYSTSTSYLLEVGVMESGVFVPLHNIASPINTHTVYELGFDNYTGSSRTIAFHNFNNSATTYYSYHYIDDVLVEYLPTCQHVDDLAVNMADDSHLGISWTAGGSESQWLVSVDGGAWTVVNTNSYTASGLAPQSTHTFVVRALCGVGDTSRGMSVSGTTTCTAVALPYSENFDAITTSTSNTSANYGLVPDCWSYQMTGTSSYTTGTYLPKVYYGSTYSHSSDYSLLLYGVGYHMLPPMPTSLDSLQLTFWDYTTSTYYGLEVGVMEGNTFVPVATINTPTSTHMQQSVDFGSYHGTSRIIAFRNYYTTGTNYYSYHYIDDVMVDYAPDCRRIANVRTVGTGVTSVTLDWEDLSTYSSWQIEYGATGFTQGSAAGTIVTATSHPYALNGLDSLATYDFYVRGICAGGDTAEWSRVASGNTTICDNAFDANTGSRTATSSYAPVNNYFRYTLSETIIDSTELLGIGEISAVGYYYNYSTAMTAKTDVTIWLQPTTKSAFSSSSDVVALDTTIAVQVYSGSLNCSQGWNFFTFDTTYTWNGHGNLMVIIDDNSNAYNSSSHTFGTSACSDNKTLVYYSDSQNPVATSPSSFTGNKAVYRWRPTMQLVSCSGSCSSPVIASLTNDYQSATVTVSGSGNSYELVYGTDPSIFHDTLTSVTGGFNITGLTPSTHYFVGARQLCDSGMVSTWSYANFTTDSLPCFDPTDLQVLGTTFNTAQVGWTSAGSATTWVVRISGNGAVRLDTVTSNPYTITGLYSNTQYTVEVMAACLLGVVESGWSTPQQFTTDLCQPVTGIAVNDITTNSATVSWQPVTGSIGYKLYYGTPGFTYDEVTPIAVAGTASNYTLNNLEGETNYQLLMINRCAEGVESAASDRVDFTTTSGGNGIYDVESGTLTLFPNPASSVVTVTVSGFDGEVEVQIVDMNGRTVSELRTQNSELTLDVSELAQGPYFVRVTGDKSTAVRKLIVR